MLTFANAALLAGLAAVVVPPIIHFLSRRRIDELDWAAMQFLQVSQKTRRKVYFEQFLLMLLRMLALAVLAFALAGPLVSTTLFHRFGFNSSERDIVILIDGSASMALKANGESGADAAKAWTARLLESLKPGDRVAIYHARQSAVPILANLTGDLDQARNSLELLSPPRGGVDWPGAVQAASTLLESARPEREIIIVTDLQRAGWADDTTLPRWELGRGGGSAGRPRVSVVNIAEGRDPEPTNLALEPIVAARGVATADREVRFRSALRSTGRKLNRPVRVRLEVDGRPLGDVPIEGQQGDPVRAISFLRKFDAGSHLVTLLCDGDDFLEDNRQDYALEVLPAVPVLIVDGSGNRRAEFLRDALAPAKDPAPAFLVKIIKPAEFTSLSQDVRGPGTPPRVLVLSNVPSLTADQNALVEKYLSDGGSVLVALGDKHDAAAWNKTCFRAGQGWLPARLNKVVTGEAKPLPESFSHPAVEIFKEPLPGGLHTASFPERWSIDLSAGINGITGTAIVRFDDREAFIAERGFARGRVAMSVVPFDNSWGTNLPVLPDFVRLVHELLYYLAGAKASERNLAPGQSIVFAPRPVEPAASVSVRSPDGANRTVPVKNWPLVYDQTRDAGPYRFTTASGRAFSFAVRNDTQESLLTPCSAEDQRIVADLVPGLKYIKEPDDLAATDSEGPQTRDLWRFALLAVALFLLIEMIATRYLVKRALDAA